MCGPDGSLYALWLGWGWLEKVLLKECICWQILSFPHFLSKEVLSVLYAEQLITMPQPPPQDQGLDHFGDSPSKHLALSLFVTEHAWAVQFGNQFPPAGLEQ